MDQEFFLNDEVVMLRFLAICQPSCDPEMYEKVLDVCRYLVDVRKSAMREDSLERCLNHLMPEAKDG